MSFIFFRKWPKFQSRPSKIIARGGGGGGGGVEGSALERLLISGNPSIVLSGKNFDSRKCERDVIDVYLL